MKIRVVLASFGALFVVAFAADKVVEAVVRRQIERSVAGSGAEVSLGRVAVNLPRRSVSVRGARVRVWHNDAATSPSGIVALDAEIALAEARGVRLRRASSASSAPQSGSDGAGLFGRRLSFRSLEIDLRRATVMLGSALIETGAAHVSTAGGPGMAAAARVDSLSVTMNGPTDKTRIALYGLSLAGLDVAALLGEHHPGARSGNRSDGTSADRRDEGLRRSLHSGGTFGARRTLAADSVTIDRAVVASSKNRKIAAPARSKPLLWQTLQRLPIALDIPTVRCGDLDVTYRELAAEATDWGEVSILNGRLTVTNLTNLTNLAPGNTPAGLTNLATGNAENSASTASLHAENAENPATLASGTSADPTGSRAANPAASAPAYPDTPADLADLAVSAPGGRFVTVELAATLMRAGELTVQARFPVDSLDNHFEMTGRVGRSDLANFNRAIEPLTGLRIASGELHSLDFRTEGTRTSSHVRLTMRYQGLAVELLRRSDHHRRALASWALNDLLIRDANPDRNGHLRTGEGTFDRDTTKSTFNFLWKSLLPGVKQTVL